MRRVIQMDTMAAFARMQAAKAAGNTMTYFDGVKIKEIMEKHGVTEAQIFLGSDRGWTETTVQIDKKGNLTAESIGVAGSIWASPMLDIDGEEIEVGTKDAKRMTIKFK